MAASPYVVDVTAETFSTVVLEGSHQRPVLVDYWADWCAPCRMLGPILDQLAEQYGGKLLVAKVDTEAQRELAAQYGIRSLPTVKLFRHGEPVDEFMGALPESEIRAFLDPHLPRESDALIARAQGLLAAGDLTAAGRLLEQAEASDPGNPRTGIARAQLQAAGGDFVAAQQTLDGLPLDRQDDPEVQALRSQMAFAQVLSDAPPPEELERRLAADPGDSEARYQLATHLIAAQDYAGALEQLLALLQRDRAYGDDAARKGMVQIFELLGGSGELVTRYRAKMMSALF